LKFKRRIMYNDGLVIKDDKKVPIKYKITNFFEKTIFLK